jgi:hypothetical protein
VESYFLKVLRRVFAVFMRLVGFRGSLCARKASLADLWLCFCQ